MSYTNLKMSNENFNRILKRKMRKVLEHHKRGLRVDDFVSEYERIHQEPLRLHAIGYADVIELVEQLPEIFGYIRNDNCNDTFMIYDARQNASVVKELNERTIIPESLITNIKTILRSNPDGITYERLKEDYQLRFKVELPYLSLGYFTMESFISELKSRVPGNFITFEENGTKKISLVQDPWMRQPSLEETATIEDRYEQQKFDERLIRDEDFEVAISDMTFPDFVWLQIEGSETIGALDILMKKLKETYELPGGDGGQDYMMPDNCFVTNMPCVALYNGLWHRALMLGFPNKEEVEVQYVDYGTENNVKKDEIRLIKKTFMSLNSQAIRVRLAVSKPGMSFGKWNHGNLSRLLELTKENKMRCKVLSYDYETGLSVVLRVKDDSGNYFSVNDVLFAEGYAKPDRLELLKMRSQEKQENYPPAGYNPSLTSGRVPSQRSRQTATVQDNSGHSSQANSGQSSQADSGHGSQAYSGHGSQADSGHGSQADSGHGSQAYSGHGSQADSAHGSQADSGHGSQAYSGHGSQADSGHGSQADSGHGSQAYSGHGSQADSAHGSQADSGHGSQADSGHTSQAKSGHTSQANSGPTSQANSGPTSQANSGHTSQAESGPTSQANSGPTSQAKSGHTSQTESGPTSQGKSGHTSQANSGPTSEAKSGHTSQTESGHSSQADSGPTSRTESGHSSQADSGDTSPEQPITETSKSEASRPPTTRRDWSSPITSSSSPITSSSSPIASSSSPITSSSNCARYSVNTVPWPACPITSSSSHITSSSSPIKSSSSPIKSSSSPIKSSSNCARYSVNTVPWPACPITSSSSHITSSSSAITSSSRAITNSSSPITSSSSPITSSRKGASQEVSTRRYVKEVNWPLNCQGHLINYRSRLCLTCSDVSQFIYGSPKMFQRLKIFQNVEKIKIPRYECPTLFNELKQYKVRGFEDASARTCLSITLIPLESCVKLLEESPLKQELRLAIQEVLDQFDPSDPCWMVPKKSDVASNDSNQIETPEFIRNKFLKLKEERRAIAKRLGEEEFNLATHLEYTSVIEQFEYYRQLCQTMESEAELFPEVEFSSTSTSTDESISSEHVQDVAPISATQTPVSSSQVISVAATATSNNFAWVPVPVTVPNPHMLYPNVPPQPNVFFHNAQYAQPFIFQPPGVPPSQGQPFFNNAAIFTPFFYNQVRHP